MHCKTILRCSKHCQVNKKHSNRRFASFFQYVKTFLSFYSCKNEFNWIVKATTHSKLNTKIMFDLVPQKLSQLWKRRLLFSLKTIHTSRLILSALSFCQLRKGTNKSFLAAQQFRPKPTKELDITKVYIRILSLLE